MTSPAAETAAPSKRLASVDALRGFDMFWIIGGRELVLATVALFISPVPASVEFQLEHVPWESFTFSAWDLIMPLFLFVSGVSLPFSLSKWGAPGEGRTGMYLRLARRLLILWILGMAVQGNLFAWDLDKLKLYSNTLQAIAAGYLIAVIFMLTMSVRVQVIATAALLIGYWAIVMWMPFPERGADPFDPWTNITKYVDKLVLGRFTDTWMYTWVLPSLSFGATVMFGVFAGYILRSGAADMKKFQRLLLAGVGCLVAGWVWGYQFPFIKYIWSSSMNLWAGGWCFVLLAVFYWVIDIRGFRKWAFPLIVIGTNAIAVYVATHLLDFDDMADVFVGKLAPQIGAFGGFLQALLTFLIPFLILLYMYKKKTFIRL